MPAPFVHELDKLLFDNTVIGRSREMEAIGVE